MAKPLHIAVFSAKPYDEKFLLAAATESMVMCCYKVDLNPMTATMAHGVEAVSAFVNDDLCRATLETLAAGGTRLIAMRCAGYNNVDLNAAAELGIRVVNVPAYSPYAVAEHTISLMLALSRNLPRAFNRVRDGNFSLDGLLGFDFYQKTVGIIGGGKIGRLVGERMLAFGCKVLVFDPYNVEVCEQMGFEVVDFDRLIADSDIITLHCPLTPETRYLINHDAIAKMKRGVMLINTSRGALMNTRALLSGLKSEYIGYLGIDVYEQEGSLFFEDHSNEIIKDDIFVRLTTFPNVIVTGHQAYFTHEALRHIADTTVNSIDAYIQGDELIHEVRRDLAG